MARRPCSAKIVFKNDIAIEDGNISEDKRRAKPFKRLEDTLMLFFYLEKRGLRIWAVLRRLFSFLEIFCEQNSFLSPPDLRAIDGVSPRT